MDANEYRCNQVRAWQSEIKSAIDRYQLKVRKYRRRVTALDVMVYSVSTILASTGVILSAVLIVATIGISSATTATSVFGIIAKKVSSCPNTKLRNYVTALNSSTSAYQKLSSLISSSLDLQSSAGESISKAEFKLMTDAYNDYLNSSMINNNDNIITPANSLKHNPAKKNTLMSVSSTKPEFSINFPTPIPVSKIALAQLRVYHSWPNVRATSFDSLQPDDLLTKSALMVPQQTIFNGILLRCPREVIK